MRYLRVLSPGDWAKGDGYSLQGTLDSDRAAGYLLGGVLVAIAVLAVLRSVLDRFAVVLSMGCLRGRKGVKLDLGSSSALVCRGARMETSSRDFSAGPDRS